MDYFGIFAFIAFLKILVVSIFIRIEFGRNLNKNFPNFAIIVVYRIQMLVNVFSFITLEIIRYPNKLSLSLFCQGLI